MPLAPARKLLLAAAALALVGCGNLPGRDDPAGPPGAIYQSSQSPTDYAQCLTQRWLATKVVGGSATVDSGPGAGGSTRLTLVISGAPGRVVEIAAQGSGSSIRYWNRSRDFGTGKPASVQAIEGCR